MNNIYFFPKKMLISGYLTQKTFSFYFPFETNTSDLANILNSDSDEENEV